MISKKSNNNGYVWVPYIISSGIPIISESQFQTKSRYSLKLISNRYATIILGSKTRKERIKKILEKIRGFES